MSVQTESKRLGDWLKWEEENQYSRDIVTVLAGSGAVRALTSGMVLGRLTKGTATAAAIAGNTGNGIFGDHGVVSLTSRTDAGEHATSTTVPAIVRWNSRATLHRTQAWRQSVGVWDRNGSSGARQAASGSGSACRSSKMAMASKR